MKTFLFSLTLLAFAAALQAESVPCDAQADVAARIALALAQHQAPVTPQAPAVADDIAPHSPTPPCPNCQCGCTVTGKCFCKDCDHPLLTKPVSGIPPGPYRPDPDNPNGPPIVYLTKPAAPHYTFLVISKSGCVPCEKLRAELMAKWGEAYGDHPGWDIWKDSPGTEAVYGGVTAYPTILLLRRRDGEKVGREIGRHVGYMSTVEMQRWLDHPDASQSRGEAVEKAAPVVYTPTYQPMMRYSAACRGSS